MLDKLLRSLQEATDMLKNQVGNIGESAKEKGYEIIEEWLMVFPKLQQYGLEITSFSLGIALSPSLEVEFKGSHGNFSRERVQAIIDENKGNKAVYSVFSSIRMAYSFHEKIKATLNEPLILKIRVKLSPEIKVFIGDPIIQ